MSFLSLYILRLFNKLLRDLGIRGRYIQQKPLQKTRSKPRRIIYLYSRCGSTVSPLRFYKTVGKTNNQWYKNIASGNKRVNVGNNKNKQNGANNTKTPTVCLPVERFIGLRVIIRIIVEREYFWFTFTL